MLEACSSIPFSRNSVTLFNGPLLTVIIGSGLDASEEYANAAEKKIAYLTRFAPGLNFPNSQPLREKNKLIIPQLSKCSAR